MPSINQYVINLFVIIPIMRGPRVFMNVSVQNIVLLTNRSFDLTDFTFLTPLSLLS